MKKFRNSRNTMHLFFKQINKMLKFIEKYTKISWNRGNSVFNYNNVLIGQILKHKISIYTALPF